MIGTLLDPDSYLLEHSTLTPEQRLAVAVFARAVRDYLADLSVHEHGWEGGKFICRRDKEDARAWLFSKELENEGTFSISAAADALGFDVEALRTQILRAEQRGIELWRWRL